MKISLLLLMLLNTGFLFSQLGPAPQSAAVENDPMANFNKWTPMMQKLFQLVKNDGETVSYYVGAEVGSAYETEEFNKGKVFYKEEDLGEFYYRYNIFSREIEVKNTLLEEEKHKALIRDPNVVLIPSKGSQKYRFLPFINEKGEKDEGYLITLYKGNSFTLYKFLEVKFSEAKAAANSMVNPKPSKFTNFTTFYYKKENGEIHELPNKKNKLLSQFNKIDSSILKNFIKEEKTDFKAEDDLIRLMAFIDQQ